MSHIEIPRLRRGSVGTKRCKSINHIGYIDPGSTTEGPLWLTHPKKGGLVSG